MQRMTAVELEAMPGDFVGTKAASDFLGCDRYSLNISAKANRLGAIRYYFAGNRLYLNKWDLLAMTGPQIRTPESVLAAMMNCQKRA